jgi:hypothetical protein
MILGRVGQLDEALLTIDEAFGIIERTGDSFTEPEVHRLKGELPRAQDPSKAAQAENSFRTGIKIARPPESQVVGVARSPRCCVTQIAAMRRTECSPKFYGWFTEGFDTADLKDAKALLEELNR